MVDSNMDPRCCSTRASRSNSHDHNGEKEAHERKKKECRM